MGGDERLLGHVSPTLRLDHAERASDRGGLRYRRRELVP